MAVIVNILNAHDDNSQWDASGGYWDINVSTNDGYLFVGDITAAYTDTSGTPKSVVLNQNGAKNWAFGELSDTDADTEITITGNTRSENDLEVINNIPNTTATGEKLGMWQARVTVNANEGYKITAAQVEFTDSYGYSASEDMTISEGGKTASWQNDDCDPDMGVTISSETASEGTPELNVTNEIANTTEQHTYDGQTTTFTVNGSYPRFRFKQPTVNYTGTDGQPKTIQMEVEVLEDGSIATATVTDIDPTKPVTITGQYLYAIMIEPSLSNCYADPELPEHLFEGDTLSVVLKANPNTAFDDTDEMKIPVFSYQDENGYYQSKPLTVSEDKQTATGQILLGDYQRMGVVAEAYPVTVVGQQYGAINVYLVTLDELAEFSGKRFFKETGSDPETGATIYENIDLGAYVNKICRVYTNIGASSTDVIRCGNYNTGVSCHQPAQDKITLDFGTAVVPAHNEDNTDYESEIQIFLPFAGFVTLNTDYAGKTIGLQYVINVVTGNGVALLSCNGVVFQVEETEPSSEIIYLSPSTQVKTVGGDDWNEMLYYGLEPYIYCKWYESATGGRNNDRQTGILGDFRGFNVFDDVTPIHTAEMLTEEQELIYTALSDGVYIE